MSYSYLLDSSSELQYNTGVLHKFTVTECIPRVVSQFISPCCPSVEQDHHKTDIMWAVDLSQHRGDTNMVFQSITL